MTTKDQRFGVLTLATPSDYLKAIGLALSLRASNPGVPTAVTCSKALMPRLRPYFDHVVEEMQGIRGFEHKVYLDHYSPFESTFFLDADVLVFKPLEPYVALWGHPAYAAVGGYRNSGTSIFGLDRADVLKRIGHERLVVIDGAGHACFKKPACAAVFEMARDVTRHYARYTGARYADEDVLSIVMTQLGLPPAPYGDFFSRYISAVPGTMQMDASKARCRFIWADTGLPFEPCMLHFAANEAPVPYTRQLLRLFRAYGVPTGGLVSMCLNDLWETRIKWRLSPRVKAVRQLLSPG